jgi:hypothetical protein
MTAAVCTLEPADTLGSAYASHAEKSRGTTASPASCRAWSSPPTIRPRSPSQDRRIEVVATLTDGERRFGASTG